MATQSDDKSVKIWRTTDWGLEAEIRKPFEDSPGSTFFRRLRSGFLISSFAETSHTMLAGHPMVPTSQPPMLQTTGDLFSLQLL
jgi:hypothetical protein